MALDVSRKDLRVGVIGAGTMGRGIAQVLAQAGIEVLMMDANAGAVAAARDSIEKVLGAQVQKGKLKQAAVDATMAHLVAVASLNDVAHCDVIVESVTEDINIKRELFRQLEAIMPEDAILATNTSSLSVTGISASSKRPGRIVGWHFFNPVPLMRLAEVVGGLRSEAWATQALTELTARIGHTAVSVNDMPGYIVNHVGRAFIPEGFRMLSEGIGEFQTIDRIVRETAGFRMGPFEFFDLIGADVGCTVVDSFYNQYYQEPRFRSSPLVAQRVAAGLLGRKTKRGFYDYSGGSLAPVPEPAAPALRNLPVWVSDADPELAKRLRDALAKEGVRLESGAQPSASAVIMVTPLGKDTTTSCVEQGLDPVRTVAVDTLFPLDRRRTLMCSPATAPDYRDAAHALLAAGGVPVSVIRDSPGFVAQRFLALIVAIGCDIAQQRIARPKDIDLAARIGLNYPNGPFAMGDALGPKRIVTILENMLSAYGDPRYRPSVWLRRRAMLGLSLLHED